jgi:hypothetical protein
VKFIEVFWFDDIERETKPVLLRLNKIEKIFNYCVCSDNNVHFYINKGSEIYFCNFKKFNEVFGTNLTEWTNDK